MAGSAVLWNREHPASTAQTALSLPTGRRGDQGHRRDLPDQPVQRYGQPQRADRPVPRPRRLRPRACPSRYSSGHGNGLFGLGWSLALPRITRKTEKGLPRYDDSDVFVLSGSEDLVPWLTKIVDPVSGDVGWLPEGPARTRRSPCLPLPAADRGPVRPDRALGARRRPARSTGARSAKDNITSLFGTDAGVPASRSGRRPAGLRLAARTRPTTRSATTAGTSTPRDDPALYSDDPDQALPESFERNRLATNRYPRRIYYGNLPDPLLDADRSARSPIPDGTAGRACCADGRRYAFEVVFDYGDWELPTILPAPGSAGRRRPELLGHGADDLSGRAAGRRSVRTASPLPGRLRDPHAAALPPGADVPPLRRAGRAERWSAPPTSTYATDPDTAAVAADRGDGPRLRPRRRRSVPLGRHARR